MSTEEILNYTNEATVEVLTKIQNMLSSDHVEDAQEFIKEQLKSDIKPIKKEIEIPKFILKVTGEENE